MKLLPDGLSDVISALQNLPGVGPRSAERYAYYLLKADPAKSLEIANSLLSMESKVKHCPVTFCLIDADKEVSELYSDPTRDKQIIMVVADPFDVVAMEKTGQYKGTYHKLDGLLSPIDGITPETLHINELLERVRKDKVLELIIATNASVEGESTAHYIAKHLEGSKVKISRLAQGLPIGLDIEYADQLTLARALENRLSF